MRIFQPIVTGSVNVLGSVTATSFTGSLFGTASWANNVLDAISSSFAATASSADSLTVRGALVVSGSTTIGDASTDTITLTAATMSLGGNLNIDSNTLFVNSTANSVGIGTNSPARTLSVSGSLYVTNTSTQPTIISDATIVAAFKQATTVDAITNSSNYNPILALHNVTGSATSFALMTFQHGFDNGNTPVGIARIGTKKTVGNNGDPSTTYAGDFFIQLRAAGGILNEALYIRSNTNVGISTNTPNYKLDVSGSGNFTNGLTVTGSLLAANITGSLLGSSSYALTASFALNAGGGSIDTSSLVTTSSFNAFTGSVVTTSSFNTYTGSNTSQFAGTASFAQTASLVTGTVINAINAQSGSNFVVTSTLAIDETLTDFAKTIANTAATWNLFQQATGSWTSAHCRYTVYNAGNSRAGEFVTSWNGTTVSYYDNATVDIGNTSDITLQSSIAASQIKIDAVAASAGWTIKMIATYL